MRSLLQDKLKGKQWYHQRFDGAPLYIFMVGEGELRPGTRVISRAFPIHGWEPAQKLKFRPRTPPVYLYIVRKVK